MQQARWEEVSDWGGRVTKKKWTASAWGLTVTYTTDNLDLVLFADPIENMRQVGIALVDESRIMRVNRRRDRKGNE
jgi:hypothetical protein